MRRSVFHRLPLCGALAVLLVFAAAAPARAQESPPSDVLTGEQLAATGETSVYDALRRARPMWLRFRARGAQVLEPSVYVDSVYAGSLDVLATIGVRSVIWVQHSEPAVARERFGVASGARAIHVSTRLPLASAHPTVHRPRSAADRAAVRVGAYGLRPMAAFNRFGMSRGTALGGTVGYAIPLASRGTLVLSAQHATMALPAGEIGHAYFHRNSGAPFIESGPYSTGASDFSISAIGIGYKNNWGSGTGVSPYFALHGSAARLARSDVEMASSENGYRVAARSDLGFGARAELGLDVPLSGRVGAFASGAYELLMLPESEGASLTVFQVGATLRLGGR